MLDPSNERLLEDSIRTLRLEKKFDRPLGIVLLSPPGAGKWELADRLARERGFVHIEVDKLQHFLAPKAKFFDDLSHVESFALDLMVELASRGYSPVIDRNITRKGYREKFKFDLESVGGTLVEIEIICPDNLNMANIAKDNREITLGERQGFILDRAYYEFKKAQVEPPIGENTYKINCQYDETDWHRLLNFLKLKLTS